MKKYVVISGPEIKILENEVNRLLNDGWELAGGISSVYKHEHGGERHIPGHLEFSQALIKIKD